MTPEQVNALNPEALGQALQQLSALAKPGALKQVKAAIAENSELLKKVGEERQAQAKLAKEAKADRQAAEQALATVQEERATFEASKDQWRQRTKGMQDELKQRLDAAKGAEAKALSDQQEAAKLRAQAQRDAASVKTKRADLERRETALREALAA